MCKATLRNNDETCFRTTHEKHVSLRAVPQRLRQCSPDVHAFAQAAQGLAHSMECLEYHLVLAVGRLLPSEKLFLIRFKQVHLHVGEEGGSLARCECNSP